MKTMKTFLTAVFALFLVNISTANDLKIRTNGNTALIIEVDQKLDNDFIKIIDKEGSILFFENINEDNYLKTFVMSDLPSGQYFVEYENNNNVKTIMVEKTNSTLKITNFEKVSFKPMFKQNADFLSVGITNPMHENVNMTITDRDGYEIIKVSGLKDLVVSKTFNTKKLASGNYEVRVTCGTKSYTKTVFIN